MDDLDCDQCPYRNTLYCKTYCGKSKDFAGDSLDKGSDATPSERATKIQDLLSMWREMKEQETRQIKVASEPYFKSRAEREAEICQCHKTIAVLESVKQTSKKWEKEEIDRKIRLISEVHAFSEAHPELPKYEPEKRTRTDEFGKPVQPSTVGNLYGLSKNQNKDAKK